MGYTKIFQFTTNSNLIWHPIYLKTALLRKSCIIKFQSFVYNLMVFSLFRVKQPPYNLLVKTFYHPEKKPCSHYQSLLSPVPYSTALGNH